MTPARPIPSVAIACGGTGGHLFPGLAVGEALTRRGAAVTLLISPKEVDQIGVRSAPGMEVVTLPAVAFERRQSFRFVRRYWQSYRVSRQRFRDHPPGVVLGMGGFTSAPPIFAARRCRSLTFIHESNSVPGRANRWLAPWVHGAFVGFPAAVRRLWNRTVMLIGTPVRPQFRPADPVACRLALGLEPSRPVLLVMGGSQGATGINQLVRQALPLICGQLTGLQFVHLTGPHDLEEVRSAYAAQGARAVVRPFMTEMELAMGAATAAISRAGASSLAELAALELPALLIPYPWAADNHQFFNALEFVQSGAARMLGQKSATASSVLHPVAELVRETQVRESMKTALRRWHKPEVADEIAARLLAGMNEGPSQAFSDGAAHPATPETGAVPAPGTMSRHPRKLRTAGV
jgi:UDP-N-acetylglucosamine--N-acetylmuramyl-(pentapeptide) pyrophosphoryl-undecaprenol N-acetylglucosamine transferase